MPSMTSLILPRPDIIFYMTKLMSKWMDHRIPFKFLIFLDKIVGAVSNLRKVKISFEQQKGQFDPKSFNPSSSIKLPGFPWTIFNIYDVFSPNLFISGAVA